MQCIHMYMYMCRYICNVYICVYRYINIYIHIYMYIISYIYVMYTHVNIHLQNRSCHSFMYGVATVSRIDKIIGLFCRILSLLQGSFAKETYDFIDPTNRSHPIHESGVCERDMKSQNDYVEIYEILMYIHVYVDMYVRICTRRFVCTGS